MKKRNILMIFLFIFAINNCLLYSCIIKTKKNLIENITVGYEEEVKVSSILNTKSENKLDTSKIGNMIYEDDEYVIVYNVEDKTPPLILGRDVTTTIGSKPDLVNKFLCGDNIDDTPNCYIEGQYDINKEGIYNLKYIAIDSNNNKSTKDFKLKVIPKSNSNSDYEEPKKTPISEYIKKYKNEKTSIGIDVSSWQYDIDWKKVKSSGVEFAMIRIGFGHTSKGEIVLDNTYINNIKNAKKEGIKVGLYFYSYASNIKEVKKQVKWIVKTLDGEKLDLPIAFDWEDWTDFNTYKISFKKLNDIANTFISETRKYGYDGMLYSSAYYLENIWKSNDKTWLAYYTDNNDYKGKYMMWQLTSLGSVSGIDTSVDINVLYK